jgi:hypothetical protein
MRPLLIFIIFFIFCSCTYSITLVHTDGTASDVVDETASNTPSASLAVPASALTIPKL